MRLFKSISTLLISLTLAFYGFTYFYSKPPSLDVIDQIVWEKIENWTIAEKELVVRNNGNAPLKMSFTEFSCGCLQLFVRTNSGWVRTREIEVPPFSPMFLKIEIEARGTPGKPYSQKLKYTSNDPVKPEGIITAVINECAGGAFFVPDSISCTFSEDENEQSAILNLIDCGEVPREIQAIASSDPYLFKCHIIDKEINKISIEGVHRGFRIAQIKVVFLGQRPGSYSGNVIAEIGKQQFKIMAPVKFQVDQPISIAPKGSVLPRISEGKTNYTARLAFSSKQEISIQDIEMIDNSGLFTFKKENIKDYGGIQSYILELNDKYTKVSFVLLKFKIKTINSIFEIEFPVHIEHKN